MKVASLTPLLRGQKNANVECVTETKCLKAIGNEDSAELDVNQRSPRNSGRSLSSKTTTTGIKFERVPGN